MQQIHLHTHTPISPPLEPSLSNETWIKKLARIAKLRQIIQLNKFKKSISKYQQLNDKNPKKINRKVFGTNATPPLDCLLDHNNNVFTDPAQIASEIHAQQTITNKPYLPMRQYQPDHPNQCT